MQIILLNKEELKNYVSEDNFLTKKDFEQKVQK